ncbi:MAG: hypothetical protein ACI8V8_001965, partial [Chitinophagales bacterium]
SLYGRFQVLIKQGPLREALLKFCERPWFVLRNSTSGYLEEDTAVWLKNLRIRVSEKGQPLCGRVSQRGPCRFSTTI